MFNAIVQETSKAVKVIDSSVYLRTAIMLFVVLYATKARYPLPSYIMVLFQSTFFRILMLSLLAIIISRDIQIGVLVATAFMITLTAMTHFENMETFEQIEHLIQIENFKEYQERI